MKLHGGCSVAQVCLTLCDPMDCSTPRSPALHSPGSLLRLVFIELETLFSRFILYCPLLLQPSIFPGIRVFSNELILHIRWPKDWSFSLRISPSNEYSGLISFRMDWLDILAVQATLKSLLQHCNSKASYLQTPLALGKTEMHFVLISTPQRCSALSLDHTVQVPCSHADSSALPGCLHCNS